MGVDMYLLEVKQSECVLGEAVYACSGSRGRRGSIEASLGYIARLHLKTNKITE